MPASSAVSSTVPEEFALLVAALAAVTDTRFARGKVHPLPGVLALVVLGLMADCRSLSVISRFGQIHPEVLAPLGLRRSPSVATLHRLLRRVSVAEVRAALAAFTRQVLTARTGDPRGGVVAVDGKTSRGVWEGGSQLHVLHVFAHTSALALDQVAVGGALEETGAAQEWVAQVADTFPGLTILTGDALYAEQDLCAAVVAGQRDYVRRLKKTNPPSLPTSRSSSPVSPPPPDAVQVSTGHGRRERRELRVSDDLAGYSAFPGLAQVAEVRTQVTRLATGETTARLRYLVTSLTPDQASPRRVLALSRGHWGIENRLFHVKDDSFGEDRHVLQTHAAGAVMSLLRTAAVNLLRGEAPLWTPKMPMTARAEWVNGHPAALLTALGGL